MEKKNFRGSGWRFRGAIGLMIHEITHNHGEISRWTRGDIIAALSRKCVDSTDRPGDSYANMGFEVNFHQWSMNAWSMSIAQKSANANGDDRKN